MRTLLSCVSVLLCGLLLMGAVNAPVMQSQSFYINDHAGVISQENRDSMLQAAERLYEETGARAVLLTIENLDGRTPEEYAQDVYNAWELGAEGAAMLLLLSTEEKRFAIHSNTDIRVTDTEIAVLDALAEADALAADEDFDLAASNCFVYIIDSMNSIYLSKGEIAIKPSEASRVPTESSVISGRDTESVPKAEAATNTSKAESTEETASSQTNAGTMVIAAAVLLCSFLVLSQTAKASRRRKPSAKLQQGEYNYQRIYSPDEPIVVRIDDVDCPPGFGGLGNRKAIYFEDVDDAEDIGIIRRRRVGDSGGETGGRKTAHE